MGWIWIWRRKRGKGDDVEGRKGELRQFRFEKHVSSKEKVFEPRRVSGREKAAPRVSAKNMDVCRKSRRSPM